MDFEESRSKRLSSGLSSRNQERNQGWSRFDVVGGKKRRTERNELRGPYITSATPQSNFQKMNCSDKSSPLDLNSKSDIE